MAAPAGTVFGSVLRRMHERDGVDTLPAHLGSHCGVPVGRITQLDIGVFRVDRTDTGPPLVARLFSADRSHAEAEADLAVLRHLSEADFPAERPVDDAPLTEHVGQAVLLTRFIKGVPKAEQPRHPILRLGARVGRLHTLPVPQGADRPAGALHHFAEGTMTDELGAAASWLDEMRDRSPGVGAGAFDSIRDMVEAADGGDGLPEGFVHPDPVPKNAIFTADGPVLVDWTSAGRGPRLPSLTLVLRSNWAAVPFMKGYRRAVTLTDGERDRLPGLLVSRQLIHIAFRVCHDPSKADGAARRLRTVQRDAEVMARQILEA